MVQRSPNTKCTRSGANSATPSPNGTPHIRASRFDLTNASSSSSLRCLTAQTAGYSVWVTIESTPRENWVSELARPIAPAAARLMLRVAIRSAAWPTRIVSPRFTTSGQEKLK